VFGGPIPQTFPLFGVKAGTDIETLNFHPLGYAAVARESYKVFRRLRSVGRIPPATRFQVSLPTPTAVVFAFIHPKHFYDVLPVYERDMRKELVDIALDISHEDLALQWDCAVETEISESPEWLARFGPELLALGRRLTRNEMMTTVSRMVDAVPGDIEAGLHLCYGDPDGHHVIQPRDSGVMVDLANRLLGGVHRRINWVHMPVPIDRRDEAYFSALAQLRKPSETELFLGLVHPADGVEGAMVRSKIANNVVPDFGVACECGLGRRPPETIPELLKLHAEIARAPL
jgi:hypothetical protein